MYFLIGFMENFKVPVSFNGIEVHTLASIHSKSIYISTVSACHADSIEISPVLKAMNVEPEKVAGTVRISKRKYTKMRKSTGQ
jgi:cysteine sulfinate desulfinase/cysteine desulfurase-like protein